MFKFQTFKLTASGYGRAIATFASMVMSKRVVNLACSLSLMAGAVGCSQAPDANLHDPNVYSKLAVKIIPSVVNISTVSTLKAPPGHRSTDDFLKRFFENYLGIDPGTLSKHEDLLPQPKVISLGTGFIINQDGDILTNAHVVSKADKIKVSFTESPDEAPSSAEIIGRDPELDVALIRLKRPTSRKFSPVTLGNSDTAKIGDYVLAVGNPFGQGHSVTHGIISQKGRTAPDFPLATYLQTDAPINPGNSGGPLINLKGEVIAINNAIDPRAHGVGFAIPINAVKGILPQLKSKGTVNRAYLGAAVRDLSPDTAKRLGLRKDSRAPFVFLVNETGPAGKAGIEPYDIVLEFNNKPVRSSSDLIDSVAGAPVGQALPVKVFRKNGGGVRTYLVTLTRRPISPDEDREERGGVDHSSKDHFEVGQLDLGMNVINVDRAVANLFGMPGASPGALVTTVEDPGPAARAGLEEGDMILEVDKSPVTNTQALRTLLNKARPYHLRVRRSDPHGPEIYLATILDLTQD